MRMCYSSRRKFQRFQRSGRKMLPSGHGPLWRESPLMNQPSLKIDWGRMCRVENVMHGLESKSVWVARTRHVSIYRAGSSNSILFRRYLRSSCETESEARSAHEDFLGSNSPSDIFGSPTSTLRAYPHRTLSTQCHYRLERWFY
jgi:hypothetical protein